MDEVKAEEKAKGILGSLGCPYFLFQARPQVQKRLGARLASEAKPLPNFAPALRRQKKLTVNALSSRPTNLIWFHHVTPPANDHFTRPSMLIDTFLYNFGQYVLLLKAAIAKPERFSMYYKETIRQMDAIGVGSVFIVILISMFIGMVTAVQFADQLGDSFVPTYYIGYIVRDITIIEMAPTITCLVLAGKVGSNLAAEIGGMRQKEHIDAMEIMGVNTAAYLIMPKLVAAIFVIPLLVAISAFVSIIGGYVATVLPGTLSHTEYVLGLRSYFVPRYVFMMFVKASVFAFLLTSVSCYLGYYVKGGSIELGEASTNAVVVSNVLILLFDFIIALLLT